MCVCVEGSWVESGPSGRDPWELVWGGPQLESWVTVTVIVTGAEGQEEAGLEP